MSLIAVINQSINNQVEIDNIEKKCLCNLSSGSTQLFFELLDHSSNDKSESNSKCESDKEYKDMNKNLNGKYNIINIEDDNESENNLILNNKEDESILSEFNDIFKNKKVKNIVNNENLVELKSEDKLEKIYTEVINNPEKEKKKVYIYDLSVIISENKNNPDKLLKNINIHINELLYKESTRGWNKEKKIYIMNFESLKKNLEKFIIPDNISIGYIYRDFNNSKSHIEKDLTKYWIKYSSRLGEVSIKSLKPDDKLLSICLDKMTKINKFKKKMGSSIFKCFKNKVQVLGKTNLIVDIIFFISYKNNY